MTDARDDEILENINTTVLAPQQCTVRGLLAHFEVHRLLAKKTDQASNVQRLFC